jgi:hypothetical protein
MVRFGSNYPLHLHSLDPAGLMHTGMHSGMFAEVIGVAVSAFMDRQRIK